MSLNIEKVLIEGEMVNKYCKCSLVPNYRLKLSKFVWCSLET